MRSWLAVVVAVIGCSSAPPPTQGDGGRDGGADAGIDAGSDAGIDGGADAGIDAGSDAGPDAGADAGPMVLQLHGSGTRAGFYVDPAFTHTALGNLEPAPGFSASVDGAVFAQVLYMSGGVGGSDVLFVVTENDSVLALDPATGGTLWSVSLGTPGPQSAFPAGCGTIYPLGITGTPVIDADARILYVVAMTMQAVGPRYQVVALSTDDGSQVWAEDLQSLVPGFDSTVQMQRGALALQGGVLYVPFGGLAGGCGDQHAWVIGVPVDDPTLVRAWKAGSVGAGIWAPSGVAADGTSIYAATCASTSFVVSPRWSDSDSQGVLRFGAGPTFSGVPADYFAPGDWLSLEVGESQLGASGVVLLDVPGATPSELGFAIGKSGDGYLIDRTNLGGVGGEVARLSGAVTDWVEGAMAAYTTASASYVAFSGQGVICAAEGDLMTLRVVAGAPPRLEPGWCAKQGAGGTVFGGGSPIATASAISDGGPLDVAVWGIGAGGGSGLLSAFDGDTGALLVRSAAPMPDIQHWISPIVVGGKLYLAGSQHVYAFDLGGAPHPADGGVLPVADGGAPRACFVPVASDQTDACAAFGLSCHGSPAGAESGTCASPLQDQACLASVGCSAGLVCGAFALPGGVPAMRCEPPCQTTADCADVFRSCVGSDAGGVCYSSACGPWVDGGALWSACGAPGECLPFYDQGGSQQSYCLAGGTADGGACDPSRGGDAGLCAPGEFCMQGTSGDACLPLCSFTSAIGLDAGGPSCAADAACVWLSGTTGFGVCAPSCSDGGPCGAGMKCQAVFESPSQSGAEVPTTEACLP